MTTFIPCTTGAQAVYGRDDGTELAVAVEAWDEAGGPYVAGTAALAPAGSLPGFLRLEPPAAELPGLMRDVRQPDRAGPRPGGQPDRPRERGRP